MWDHNKKKTNMILSGWSMFLCTSLVVLLLSKYSNANSGTNNIFEVSSIQEVIAKNGVVAADDGRCSKVGRDVLKDRGHAVDAAIATGLCLGVVSSADSGIGGGGFMLLRLANGTVEAFDFREAAPKDAYKDMYHGNRTQKASGPLSIATPGEIMGYYEAWKRYGQVSWQRLIKPAKNYARYGFEISKDMHMQMKLVESDILNDPGLCKIFAPNGHLLDVGDICFNPLLAETLERISNSGADEFYNGETAVRMVQDIQKVGGILQMEDLQKYRLKMRELLSTDVMGLRVFGMPPPSSGGASMALYDFLKEDRSLLVHREIESLKHAFAVRTNLGDPDFVDLTDVMSDMLNSTFADELRESIKDDTTFPPKYYGGKWNPLHDNGTSHLSIIDPERNAVALTSSVNYYFGSRFLSPSTGIVMNNVMDDFSIPTNETSTTFPLPDEFSYSWSPRMSEPVNVPPPAPSNFIQPFKRPLSSMSPTIVVQDGKLRAVMGGSGGPRIIAATTEVFLNYFARKMSPLMSVFAARYYHQWIPNYVELEISKTPDGYIIVASPEICVALFMKGHSLKNIGGGAVVQFAIQEHAFMGSYLVAISDPRKGGTPAGF